MLLWPLVEAAHQPPASLSLLPQCPQALAMAWQVPPRAPSPFSGRGPAMDRKLPPPGCTHCPSLPTGCHIGLTEETATEPCDRSEPQLTEPGKMCYASHFQKGRVTPKRLRDLPGMPSNAGDIAMSCGPTRFPGLGPSKHQHWNDLPGAPPALEGQLHFHVMDKTGCL